MYYLSSAKPVHSIPRSFSFFPARLRLVMLPSDFSFPCFDFGFGWASDWLARRGHDGIVGVLVFPISIGCRALNAFLVFPLVAFGPGTLVLWRIHLGLVIIEGKAGYWY
jgi:hypothetical protein